MTKRSDKRPHEKALELLVKGDPVTPTELEAFVGTGPYASKHIWFLRKLGYDITIKKDGRNVVSYTYNGVGTYVEPVAKEKKAKTVKVAAKKAKPAKAKKPGGVGGSPAKKAKSTKKAVKKAKTKPVKERELPDSGEVASYAIDPDWDAAPDNVAELL